MKRILRSTNIRSALKARQGGFILSPFLMIASKSDDSDAIAWAAAVVAASGTYTPATRSALSNFFISAKTKAYNSKLSVFNPMCGTQLAACLVQRANGSWAQATNTSFVSGDYTEATGLTGNGTSKRLNTGFIPASVLSANDTHFSFYNRSSSAAMTMGAGTSSDNTERMALFGPYTDAHGYSDQYNNVNGRITITTISTPYGFIVGTRTAANSHVVYRNAVSIGSKATNTNLGTVPATNPVFIFAHNKAGLAQDFGTGPCAAYSIGTGLSAADVTNYYADLQAFQTALGRNV